MTNDTTPKPRGHMRFASESWQPQWNDRDQPFTVVLYLDDRTARPQRGYDGKYRLGPVVRAGYVNHEDRIRSLGGSHLLENLELSATAYDDEASGLSRERGFTYWNDVIRSSSVTLQQAEDAVKVLGAIRRGLDRMAKPPYRDPATFGEFVVRVGAVFGIEHGAYVASNEYGTGGGLRTVRMAALGDHIDTLERRWKDGSLLGLDRAA